MSNSETEIIAALIVIVIVVIIGYIGDKIKNENNN